ncbi:Reverse transcriptase domain [Cinara cedri]|uniref:Reverse transcriptase domain n=1 Tax=Cinara cedri TaxID=506608 RepID=A0A5E4NDL0_9HEMI|nr:Reverse transcriptase domain [Cinara cedri]
MLFNLYIEEVLKELRVEVKQGVRIGGETISVLRFADDIAFCAETENDLQKVLTKVNKILWDKYGMQLNKKKTKVMACSKTNQVLLNIHIDNARIEQVHHFNYLGSKITEDGRCKDEIISRIAQAKMAFQNKKHLLTTNSMDLEIRKRFLKIYVWNIALYGCETWKISAIEKRKLEAFEMWCYLRRAKIIGHLLRHESLSKTVIEGDVEGHIGKGRPRMEYMKQIIIDMGKNSYKELKELSNDRVTWRTAANQSKD